MNAASDGPRIVVVEDDADTRIALCEVLTGEGYCVQVAHDGEEALVAISANVSLVIVDLMMPGMSGWELLDRLEERLGRVPPVLVLSAARNGHDARTSRCVHGFLDKPVDLDQLLTMVEQCIGGRRR